jgi:hypothetical protein
MKTASLVSFLLCSLLFAGCAVSGKHWWNPMTWRSSSEARTADRAESVLETRQQEAIKAAHVEVAKTGEVLLHAPESREVDLARRFNDNAEALLTQGSGALALEEIHKLKQLVANLRSENAQVRAAAEARQGAAEKALATLSAGLAEAQRKLGEAQADLRTAFDRENALADQLRNERFVRWGLAGLSLVLGVGWLYVRYVAGGLPSALGRVLRDAEKKSPALADDLRGLLDANLDRNEQAAVRKHFSP